MKKRSYYFTGQQALKFNLAIAPIAFVFTFFTYPWLSPYEEWANEIITAQFKEESIDTTRIVENRGFKNDVITVNEIEYVLNFEGNIPNELIEDIKNHIVTKEANSEFIELKYENNKIIKQLWNYDKRKFFIKRIIFSTMSFIFFIGVGLANYYVSK